jgi:hypothetical protein
MPFHITIIEETDMPVANSATQLPLSIERYSQRVDAIDLQAIIIAVNKGPKKVRADAGIPRKKQPEVPK